MIKTLNSIVDGTASIFRGLGVTLKNFFAPVVTQQYPQEKRLMTERYRGLVDLYPERCISCLLCVKICPTNCLALTFSTGERAKKTLETFTYNMELCCFCGLCEQVCPTDAIYLNKTYEVATYDRRQHQIDLLKENKYGDI